MTQHRVVLHGGPQLSANVRVCEVDDLSANVKMVHGNGREHFAYSGATMELDGEQVHRFDWIGRTKIAE
ncbi:DUF5988 family protein [Lentzea kentuckyensis]|uniref:DUF5988 family protein n=1 Tax=Lentzea kentuckyensis TaxID=360086 RepID=UPI002481D080|nr:DUF5988 family protein [Lentzea kentuckyensis]